MKKFYLPFFSTALGLLGWVQASQAQFTGGVFATLATCNNCDVSVPSNWQGAPFDGAPNFAVPCHNCQIILNGSTVVTPSFCAPPPGVQLNGASQVILPPGATLNLNSWVDLDGNSWLEMQNGSTLNISDEFDISNGSYIRIDNSGSINSFNLAGIVTFCGPLANAVGSAGIFTPYQPQPASVYDVVLSEVGQGNSAGTISFSEYTINCGGSAQPPCGLGIVYGPAITETPGPLGVSQFVATSPLPVVLTRFAALLNPNNTVTVSWATSQETNSDYFEVQRSADQTEWTALGQVKAMGNSSIATNYSYNDNAPLPGVNYYRLKMVDLDGKYVISKIAEVDVSGGTSPPLVVYNNPFTDQISLKMHTTMADNLSLTLTDMMGRVLVRQYYNAQKGDNLLTMTPFGAPDGVYILSIQGNTYSQTVKLVRAQ